MFTPVNTYQLIYISSINILASRRLFIPLFYSATGSNKPKYQTANCYHGNSNKHVLFQNKFILSVNAYECIRKFLLLS